LTRQPAPDTPERRAGSGPVKAIIATDGSVAAERIDHLHIHQAPLAEPGASISSQVVVGEIPRQPLGYLARDSLGILQEGVRHGQVAVVCAVTGMRGVGKTQLAGAYARMRVQDGWGLVGWVSAESRDSLLAGLARVAARLGIVDAESDSLESARRLREYLDARTSSGLLVFDNATDPSGLRPFLPATGGIQVVITTTDASFIELGDSVEVTSFSREESLKYLQARTGLDDEAGAAALSAELGDLPIALAQAAATIRSQRMTYLAYLDQLRRVPVSELLSPIPGGDYPHAASAALLLSIQVVERDDPFTLTSELLRILGAMSPDGIRTDLLGGGESGPISDVARAIERCMTGSLLAWSVSGNEVIMHRLLGRVLRERDQASGKWAATVKAALDLLEPQLFEEEYAWTRREEGTNLIAQIEALNTNVTSASEIGQDLATRLLRARSWTVRHLIATADFSRAINIGEEVLADHQRVLSNDHPDTTTSRDNLAHAYGAMHQSAKAIPLLAQALADRERILGPDHPDTMTSRNNLGQAHLFRFEPNEAIPLLEETLDDRARVLGRDHPDTLTSLSNLAQAYHMKEMDLFGINGGFMLGEGRDLHEVALADRERVLGADHPDTISSRINVALCWSFLNFSDKAIPLLERALADAERVLGPDNPKTIAAQQSLAEEYCSVRRFDAAIPLLERSLAQYERIWGTQHPHTERARDWLADAREQASQMRDSSANPAD
jgi:tetratricopeptide (TPR) repeat protein